MNSAKYKSIKKINNYFYNPNEFFRTSAFQINDLSEDLRLRASFHQIFH